MIPQTETLLEQTFRNVMRPRPKGLTVIAVVPMLQTASAVVVVEALPPNPRPRPDDPEGDVERLPYHWQYIIRWARQWNVPKPEVIHAAVIALRERLAHLRPNVLLDVTDCGKIMADALNVGATLVLESALGPGQLEDTDDGTLRMARPEARGAVRALSAAGRLIISDMRLAEEIRSRIFKPPEGEAGLERALALGLWYAIRCTGDPDLTPKKRPEDEEPARPVSGFMDGIKGLN